MAFFLLSQDADGLVSVLSPVAFDTRALATAELARMTADPDFAAWDSEVFVVDLGVATPVLLVRPATVEPLAVCDPGPEEPEVLIEEIIIEALEPHTMMDDLDTLESPSDPQVEAVTAEEVVVLEAPVVETVPAPELAPELAPETEDAFVVVADAPVEAPVSLKDALLRTTNQMEAEGIVAPASVTAASVAEPSTEIASAPAADVSQGDEVAPSGVVDPLNAPVPVWPWDVSGDDAEDVAEPLDKAPASEVVESPAESMDPQDVPAPFDLDLLEEPSPDDGGLIRVVGAEPDADFEAASRPVILGAYSDSQETASDEVDLESVAGPEPEPDPIQEEVPIPEVQEPPAEPIPAGYEAPDGAMQDSTCDDCIYTETCPNRGERTPADCGSFQWR